MPTGSQDVRFRGKTRSGQTTPKTTRLTICDLRGRLQREPGVLSGVLY
jgi:hypothetical protein